METKKMVRDTSVEAYHKIKDNGLLSERRLQVYECVYKFGPITAREAVNILCSKFPNIAVAFSSYAARFSELRDMGVFKEVGTKVDPETKMNVIVWDVTSNIPERLQKKESNMGLKHLVKVDKQLIEIIVELHCIFNNYDKIHAWLYVKNLNLGGSAPIDLIKKGRGHKVLEFVKNKSGE